MRCQGCQNASYPCTSRRWDRKYWGIEKKGCIGSHFQRRVLSTSLNWLALVLSGSNNSWLSSFCLCPSKESFSPLSYPLSSFWPLPWSPRASSLSSLGTNMLTILAWSALKDSLTCLCALVPDCRCSSICLDLCEAVFLYWRFSLRKILSMRPHPQSTKIKTNIFLLIFYILESSWKCSVASISSMLGNYFNYFSISNILY